MIIMREEKERLPAFLKTGKTLGTFYNFGKDFSFKQLLNNFSRIGDNSGLIFLRATTFLGSRLETSRVVMKVLLRLCSMKRGKLGREWSLSSNLEFEANIRPLRSRKI